MFGRHQEENLLLTVLFGVTGRFMVGIFMSAGSHLKKIVYIQVVIWIVSANVAVACGPVQGYEPGNEALAEAYHDFYACRNLQVAEIADCVAETTEFGPEGQLNKKVSRWLLGLDHMGAMGVCPEGLLFLFPRSDHARHVAIRCVDYEARGGGGKALLYFSLDRGKVKISGIQVSPI